MNEREQQRKIRHRLAVLGHAEEVSGNVAATCRYYGISRTLFCRWRNRFDELSEDGLRDRTRTTPSTASTVRSAAAALRAPTTSAQYSVRARPSSVR